MKVTFEGRVWELDLNSFSFQQAMAIQMETGLSISEFQDVLDVPADDDGKLQDPGPKWLHCIGCVYWLMHNQNGDKFPLAGMDFDLSGFLVAMNDAMQAEVDRIRAMRAAEAAEPDPTPPVSPPDGQRSPEPASRPATTPQHRVREEAVTAS